MPDDRRQVRMVPLQEIPAGQNEPVRKVIVPLDGKLITAADPATIGRNFRSLINMRYGNSNPRSVGGMTKINATALTTYLKVRGAIHFRKNNQGVM